MSESQPSQETGIIKAIRYAGGQVALAQKLSAGKHGKQAHVSQQSVSEWRRKGFVPTHRAEEISECVHGRVPPGDLIDPALRKIAKTSPSIT